MSAETKNLEGSNPPKEKQTETWNATTVVALIGAIATITVALIGALSTFPPFIAVFQKPTPTVTPASSPTVSTDTPFPLVVLQVKETPKPLIAVPVVTDTSAPLPALTESSSQPAEMNVRLSADKTTGKRPLTVHFDARGSFLRAPSGEIYTCKGGPCNYTWGIYKDGQRIGTPAKNSTGTFQYTFGQRGTYIVTVYICRGLQNSDCMGSGISIQVQ